MRFNARQLPVILIAIFTLAVYWLSLGGPDTELFRNIAYLLAPVYAVLAGLYALKAYGTGGQAARPLALITLGLLFWCLGEVLWVYYDFIVHETPYPSLADWFYLLAYPFLFAGLIDQVITSHISWKKFGDLTLFLLTVIAVMLIAVSGYFDVYLAFDGSASALSNGVAIAYGLADVVLILCALLVLILAWEFKGGNFMRFYLGCFLALAVTWIADTGFAMYHAEYVAGAWFLKDFLDSLWIGEYLIFASAFVGFGASLTRAQKRLLAKVR